MRQLLLLAAVFMPAAPVSTTTRPSGLPEPPQQTKKWAPPKTTAPDAFIRAAARLFEMGLADPRGCEYRAVTLVAEDRYNANAEPLKTHAWVLPAGAGSGRFAVGWDGLVYAVAEVGPAADVVGDVRAAVKRHLDAMGDENPNAGFRQGAIQRQQDQPPKHDGWLADTAVALLLRLGRGELAGALWDASELQIDPKNVEDPYVILARAWVEKTFERGLAAHLRGDDRLALACFRPLAAVAPTIEAEARSHGWKPDPNRGGRFTEYLDQLSELLADQERRATKPARKPLVCIGPGRHPDAAVRIAGLIDRLEDVAAQQWANCYWGFNGNPSWEMDPILDALTREGDAAVKPLLQCFERDNRLTRSIEYQQFGRNARSIPGAFEAAYRVLGQSDFSPTASGEGQGDVTRHDIANLIRGRMARPEAKLPIAERWFRRLADDAAGTEEWQRAVTALLAEQRSPLLLSYTSRYAHATAEERKPNRVGDSLRGRAGPALSDLIVKRINKIEEPELAIGWAIQLNEWDKAAALPILKSLTNRCRTAGQLSDLAMLFDARQTAGDPTALDEYAAWISEAVPQERDPGWQLFNLMMRHTDHPTIARAAERLFGDRKSPWRPTFRHDNNNGEFGGVTADLVTSSLLRFPAFRAAVLEMLNDKTAFGTLDISKSQGAELQFPGRSEGWGQMAWDAPEEYIGTVRVCDYVTHKLTGVISSAPRFELYWPEPKRNLAIAAVSAFLGRHGSRVGGEHTDGDLAFPTLGRPATRADVDRTEAIFSLEGQGPARVVQLPRPPLAAKWLALKELPIETSRMKNGQYVKEKDFLQNGSVWQAEEVQINGQWQRFYGFAGCHRLARVPATEIEFPADGNLPWVRYTGTVDARITSPIGTIDPDQPGTPRRTVGAAVPVSLMVRSAGGLPMAMPNLNGRVLLRAWYSPEVIAPQGMLAPAAKTDADWQELVIKPGAAFPDAAGRSLEPAVELAVGDLDLGRWFDLSKPGFYRVRLTATGGDEGIAEPIVFSLGTPP